jgi:hypothetical protein
VVDFERFSIGDPARDFAPLLYGGAVFLDAALDAYMSGGDISSSLISRIRRYWELRELEGIVHCLAVGDGEELEACVAKVRRGPILN